MKKHGFNLAASCAGKASFTKWIKYQGKRAYITVNDQTGESFPITLEDPVRVAIHDLRSGEEVEPHREINSLGSYLQSLQE
ncbi:MAG: hypothetical protein C4567_18125 [Deltaproteobacteria bacterium]|nr:MAG: hypothetical protein C4567_18125 [Deltaproteobacteria bacterium]